MAILLDFARYWGLTPWLSRPYRAQTKGDLESGPAEPISSNLVESCEWLSCWISHGIGVSLHGCPGRIGHKPRVTWNRAQRSFLCGLQGGARGNAADKRL